MPARAGDILDSVLNFLLSILAAALYSIASARLYISLDRREPLGTPAFADGAEIGVVPSSRHRRRVTLGIAFAALLLHAWIAWSQTGLPASLRFSFFTALAVVALVVVLLQLLLCLRYAADFLGLVVWPLAAVALIASQASFHGVPVRVQAVQIHVALSIAAYAALALAAAQAVMVAVQRHYLNQHRPGGFLRALPPLESTESLLFMLMSAGFALLTLSLASGFFYLEDMFAQHLVHKTVLSVAAWAIFGILLFGRWRFGWRGRRVVHWTLGGYATLLVAYFGSKFVLELVLERA